MAVSVLGLWPICGLPGRPATRMIQGLSDTTASIPTVPRPGDLEELNPNRISSSGRGRPDQFKLDQRP
jgi:hypothetical protein